MGNLLVRNLMEAILQGEFSFHQSILLSVLICDQSLINHWLKYTTPDETLTNNLDTIDPTIWHTRNLVSEAAIDIECTTVFFDLKIMSDFTST